MNSKLSKWLLTFASSRCLISCYYSQCCFPRITTPLSLAELVTFRKSYFIGEGVLQDMVYNLIFKPALTNGTVFCWIWLFYLIPWSFSQRIEQNWNGRETSWASWVVLKCYAIIGIVRKRTNSERERCSTTSEEKMCDIVLLHWPDFGNLDQLAAVDKITRIQWNHNERCVHSVILIIIFVMQSFDAETGRFHEKSWLVSKMH